MAYVDLLANARQMAANAKGYDQGMRGKDGYWDCSSFVGHALKGAGVNINPFLTTSDMNPYTKKNAMAPAGFEWHEGMDGVQEGDVLWKNGHTELYSGNGNTVGAHSKKNGVSEYKMAGGYNGYWRYTGDRGTSALTEVAQSSPFPAIRPVVAPSATGMANVPRYAVFQEGLARQAETPHVNPQLVASLIQQSQNNIPMATTSQAPRLGSNGLAWANVSI